MALVLTLLVLLLAFHTHINGQHTRGCTCNIHVLNYTSLWAPTRKVAGMMMSGTLVLVDMVTGVGRGLVMVMTCDTLFLTGVVSSMVPMMPGGVDLKLTW